MRRLPFTRRIRSCATLILLTLLPFHGCSDDDDDNPVDPGATPAQFQGLYNYGPEHGYIKITIGTDDLAPAHRSGALASKTTSAKAELTPFLNPAITTYHGSYDPTLRTLSLSGGGTTFHGSYDPATATISGTITTSLHQGFFVGAVGGMQDLDVYCGTFSSESPAASGQWKAVVMGNKILGSRAENLGTSYVFSGTVSGSETDAIREISVHHDLGSGMTLVAEGTLDTETQVMAGTYTLDDGSAEPENGPWSSTPCHNGTRTSFPYLGAFMSAGEGGRMGVTIEDAVLRTAGVRPAASTGAHRVAATAVLTQDTGATHEVAGFYDHDTDSLALSGSGYAMQGVYDESLPYPGFQGRYQGPAGDGLFVCLFGSSSTITVLCGAFENADQTASGRWNIAMYGEDVVGLAASSNEDTWLLEGAASVRGTIWTIQLSSSDGQGGTLNATGTLDTTTNTVTGTWAAALNSEPVDSGTWSGSLCPGGAD